MGVREGPRGVERVRWFQGPTMREGVSSMGGTGVSLTPTIYVLMIAVGVDQT